MLTLSCFVRVSIHRFYLAFFFKQNTAYEMRISDLSSDVCSSALRMPYVTVVEKGPVWVSKRGAQFGLQNGMGSAGREYIPGQIQRSDRMAATGLYDDGKKGIRRLTDPDQIGRAHV